MDTQYAMQTVVVIEQDQHAESGSRVIIDVTTSM
jgi:hypothetical protein